MFARVSLGIAVGVLLAGSFASQASAQFGPGGYGLGFFNYGTYSYGGNYRIPYYALYPPVYYSYPVARPYGYSPFAYPPGTITPEATPKQSAAVEYLNPYVPQPEGTKSGDQTVSTGRMYYNPYVKQPQTASKVAATAQSSP